MTITALKIKVAGMITINGYSKKNGDQHTLQ